MDCKHRGASRTTAASNGDIEFENTTGGASGGTISGTVDLGGVIRKINVANSVAAANDLTISSAISSAGFPPVILQHMDFNQVYMQSQQRSAEAAPSPAQVN